MRGVWVAVCLLGAIGSTIAVALLLMILFELRADPAALRNELGGYIGPLITCIGLGAACVVGLFLRPSEIAEITRDEGPGEHRAAWLDELNAGPPPKAPGTDTDPGSAS